MENGGTVTASDIQQIAAAVKSQLASESKDLSQYENVETLSGVSSLPGFMESGATKKLVRVALSVLKGVDGKTPEITSDGQAIKWRYTGETQWNTLVQLSLLKGDKGEDGEKVQLRKGDTGIEWKYEDEEAWNTLVPMADLSFTYDELTDEQKQEISKKPILSEVSATAGDTASGSFSPDGTDEQGNPKYVLNLVSPRGEKGETGKTPILQKGTITTLEPTEEATFELVQSGTDGSGNPIYKMNLGLPKGNPGDGGGNVNVTNGSALQSANYYAFNPSTDGSLDGTFNVIPNASGAVSGLMSKENYSKLDDMKQVWKIPVAVLELTENSTSDEIVTAFGLESSVLQNIVVYIASAIASSEYSTTAQPKCFIGNRECLMSGSMADNAYTLDFNYVDSGKLKIISITYDSSTTQFSCKLSESGGGTADDTYWLPVSVYELSAGATREEILAALGDTRALSDAVAEGKKIYIKGTYLFSYVSIPVSVSILGDILMISFPFVSNSNSDVRQKIIRLAGDAESVKVIYPEGYKLNSSVFELTTSSESADISTAVGGESGLKNIIQAIKDGNRLVISGVPDKSLGLGEYITAFNTDVQVSSYLEGENGNLSIAFCCTFYAAIAIANMSYIISYNKTENTFTCNITSK